MRHSAFVPTALAALLALCSAPAFAGTAENAFLAKLVGAWSGGGQMTGADAGPVTCKLTFKPKGAGVAFSGRCNVQDLGAQSFSGVLSYDDATKKYQAASANQTAVGVKSGSSVVFTTKMRSIAGAGTSVMKLGTSRIDIDFDIARGTGGTGGKHSKSHLIFTK